MDNLDEVGTASYTNLKAILSSNLMEQCMATLQGSPYQQRMELLANLPDEATRIARQIVSYGLALRPGLGR